MAQSVGISTHNSEVWKHRLRYWAFGRPISDEDLRRNSVDALRLGLALLVVFSHAYPLSGNLTEPFAVWTHGLTSLGEVAVAGFFTLSGFLITRSYERAASLSRYLWHRGLRILPGFWVCLLITAFVFAPLSAKLSGMSQHALWAAPDGPFAYILSNWRLQIQQWAIAGLPINIPYPHAFDGSLWTLWLEVRCYIAVAVLGALGVLRFARWLFPVLSVILIGLLLSTWLHPSVMRTDLIAPYFWQWMDSTQLNLQLWTCFFVGATAYLYRQYLPLSPLVALVALVGFVLLSPTPLGPLSAVLLLSYAMLTLGFRVGVRQAMHLRRVGDLSYGAYIYAFPVQQLLAQLGFAALPVGLFALLGVIATLPMAYASYRLVEAPSMKLKAIGMRKPQDREARGAQLQVAAHHVERLGVDEDEGVPTLIVPRVNRQ